MWFYVGKEVCAQAVRSRVLLRPPRRRGSHESLGTRQVGGLHFFPFPFQIKNLKHLTFEHQRQKAPFSFLFFFVFWFSLFAIPLFEYSQPWSSSFLASGEIVRSYNLVAQSGCLVAVTAWFHVSVALFDFLFDFLSAVKTNWFPSSYYCHHRPPGSNPLSQCIILAFPGRCSSTEMATDVSLSS